MTDQTEVAALRATYTEAIAMAEREVRHFCPDNSMVSFDPTMLNRIHQAQNGRQSIVEQRVFLGGPTLFARLISADYHGAAVAFMQAVAGTSSIKHSDYCDRCLENFAPPHRLWVPSGTAVIQFDICDPCRQILDAMTPLTWQEESV